MVADDLEARLTAAAAAVHDEAIAARRCDRLDEQISDLDQQVTTMRAQLVAEAADVERLEGLTFSRVLASLLGAREDRLAHERAEADVAQFRLGEAEARLEGLRRERATVRGRQEELAGAATAYTAVLREKERLLQATSDPRAQRLLELAEQRGRVAGELGEVRTARRAAASATQALRRVDSELEDASNWDTFSKLFRSENAARPRLDRLDHAAASAALADSCMSQLRVELADVTGALRTPPQLAISGLTRFMETWFDHIFTDTTVRDRIERARALVKTCLDWTTQVQAQLAERTARAESAIASLETDRRSLLSS